MFSMYPHTITVFNKFSDRRGVTYYPTQIMNVLYQDKQAVKTGSEIHSSDNNGYVQIPYLNENAVLQDCYIADTDYIKPSEWQLLPNKELHWTLQKEDFILKGSVEIKIYTEDEINAILAKRLTESIEDIDVGFTLNNHYGVTLK